MVLVRAILGDLRDPRFAGRAADPLEVGWAEATKRRLRARTLGGADVGLDLPDGTFLADGSVLLDDGARVVVVRRTVEPALVVRVGAGDVAAAARVAHAFGNQHVPIDLAEDGAIRVPLTTSEAIARATVAGLGLDGVRVSVEPVALAAREPLSGGAGQAHGHGHGHGHG